MICRVLGALSVLLGLALTALLGWQLVLVPADADRAQEQATDTLLQQWTRPENEDQLRPTGEPVAYLSIPRIDQGWTVVEGTDQPQLAIGPGHYTGSALPGQIGNFAVAGHRVGAGAPFDRLDEIEPCDRITVDTAHHRYTYRVLPFDSIRTYRAPEPGRPVPRTWSEPGRQIVSPDRGDLVLPVPGRPSATPRNALLTLTTCHPRHSAQQRLIVLAELVDSARRTDGLSTEGGST